ncbi:MAG: alpha-E domain-containing protein [Pseudomonadota bacterium]|nr:alpha-E domain-containing protein [Pseudomonadota bacterium]
MMLSRVASNMYWFARYLERAENTARIITVNANLVLDLPKDVTFGWEPLIAITGSRESFDALYKGMEERNVLRFMLSQKKTPGSLISSLINARENLRTTRDIVPREAWEHLNSLFFYAEEHANLGLSRRGRHEYLRTIIDNCQLITGLLAGTMSHDEAYEFIRLGRNLERADMTTRILDVRTEDLLEERPTEVTAYDRIQWMSVLKSLTAYQMYRRHVRTRVTAADVIRFLTQDTKFPRALLHCLGEMESCLKQLPANEDALRPVTRLQRLIQQADIKKMANDSAALHHYMDDLQVKLADCHTHISSCYFGDTAKLEQCA